MTIAIGYCTDCECVVSAKVCLHAPSPCTRNVTHYHDDLTSTVCTNVSNIDEDLPTSYPATMSDETVVNSEAEFLTYLEKYWSP